MAVLKFSEIYSHIAVTPFAHTPVLASEVMELLDPQPGRIYCDGTVGGGGHARLILERSSPTGRLVGIDRDPLAVAAATEALAEFGDRVTIAHGRFSEMNAILAGLGIDRVDGMLLDVGTSSPQFDMGERGFSFAKDGPIDMRMDPTGGETALELMRRLSPDELAHVLRAFGEEAYSKRIAAHIKDAMKRRALHTTTELAALVSDAIPAKVRRNMKIHPATRTFQALRIAVNHELDELETFLAKFPEMLAPGGRCAVICFHSLEDRLVKQRFRELAFTSSLPPAMARQIGEPVEPVCITLTRKPVFAGDAEVAENPRARSARVRACQKVAS